MNCNEKGVELIKKWEGLKLKMYLCPAGFPTIGYGHKIKSGENIYNIDIDQAKIMLKNDVAEIECFIRKYLDMEISENQFSALCSLVYNIGVSNFKNSTLLKRINNNDLKNAAKEFERWVYVNGKKNAGLIKRREEEIKLFKGEL